MSTPIVFTDTSSLTSTLRRRIGSERIAIVSVDGLDGSGKTHLATRIAELPSTQHIEIDEFLDRNKGGYLQHLKYQDIRETLYSPEDSILVVDGVCIEKVLRQVGREPDLRIYVKRVGPGSYWSDGSLFARGRSADEVIAEEEEQARLVASKMGSSNRAKHVPCLAREIIRYHYEYWPHENADLIFERTDRG